MTKYPKFFCSHSRKTCGNNFRFHFYHVSPHLREILIAILSVHPSVTFRCSKKQQTHRKADGGETSTVGGETSSEWAKRPGGETSKGRNVQGAKRPGGETSWWRNVQGVKRPVKGRNVQGVKRQRGETSCYRANRPRGPNIHREGCISAESDRTSVIGLTEMKSAF